MLYKNWEAICKIEDYFFMTAMAMLDLSTEFGRSIATRLPEFFSEEQKGGPVPLSVLRIRAEKNARKENTTSRDHLVSFNSLNGLNIPTFDFSTGEIGIEYEVLPLPEELEKARHAKTGDVFPWHGRKIVVLENNSSCEVINFALVELVIPEK